MRHNLWLPILHDDHIAADAPLVTIPAVSPVVQGLLHIALLSCEHPKMVSLFMKCIDFRSISSRNHVISGRFQLLDAGKELLEALRLDQLGL